MTDDSDDVGSVSEEAAKLFAALQDWAKESGAHQAKAATESAAEAASEAVSGMAAHLHDINDHIGNGPDCVYCPICQAIKFVRTTSPEVKENLTVAAAALLQAAAGLLNAAASQGSQERRSSGVEKIDLTDDAWEED